LGQNTKESKFQEIQHQALQHQEVQHHQGLQHLPLQAQLHQAQLDHAFFIPQALLLPTLSKTGAMATHPAGQPLVSLCKSHQTGMPSTSHAHPLPTASPSTPTLFFKLMLKEELEQGVTKLFR